MQVTSLSKKQTSLHYPRPTKLLVHAMDFSLAKFQFEVNAFSPSVFSKKPGCFDSELIKEFVETLVRSLCIGIKAVRFRRPFASKVLSLRRSGSANSRTELERSGLKRSKTDGKINQNKNKYILKNDALSKGK